MTACADQATNPLTAPTQVTSAFGQTQARGAEQLPFHGSLEALETDVVAPPHLLVNGTATGTGTQLGRFTATLRPHSLDGPARGASHSSQPTVTGWTRPSWGRALPHRSPMLLRLRKLPRSMGERVGLKVRRARSPYIAFSIRSQACPPGPSTASSTATRHGTPRTSGCARFPSYVDCARFEVIRETVLRCSSGCAPVKARLWRVPLSFA